jgi:2-polyprenyl-3-methyl-5-hydroxy-6-metoxy-1,4-benzoquinol methylase
VDIRTGLLDLAPGFDVVTMCEVLEHLDEPESVVDAALALVKPGGRFILSCPHDDAIPDPEHVRIWGHDELFHLLARYSETVSFQHFPPPYFHIWMLAHLRKPVGGPERHTS